MKTPQFTRCYLVVCFPNKIVNELRTIQQPNIPFSLRLFYFLLLFRFPRWKPISKFKRQHCFNCFNKTSANTTSSVGVCMCFCDVSDSEFIAHTRQNYLADEEVNLQFDNCKERTGEEGFTIPPFIMILFDRRSRRWIAHLIPLKCVRDLRWREREREWCLGWWRGGQPIGVSPRNNNILIVSSVYWRVVLGGFGQKIGGWCSWRR